MHFKQITIVGTGLMGGSLGLAFKANALAGRIIGCDRDGILTIAQKLGAIDEAFTDLALACGGSDLIVLAMPVGAIIDTLGRLPKLSAEALVTDVGSTKREICETAKKVWGEGASARFLPGHPMAGKAEGGIENA
ncbi:MAG TPA: prephenate dehydrogenase/arogenate dehydrogenase family protein, partial [Terriglobales bacterium]|nr:prephenate dehydrogenase/arogenate dehydrogenase family protein [Terriglobales bacterium]